MTEGDHLNFKSPNPIKKDHSKRDPSKLCRNHRNIGHHINECFDPKEEIEDLICRGHLAQYARRYLNAKNQVTTSLNSKSALHRLCPKPKET